MSRVRSLTCAATLAVLATFAVVPARAASPSGPDKDCHVVSFKYITGVIGAPIKEPTAWHLPGSEAGGIHWTCSVDSQNYGVSLNAYCKMPALFVKSVFGLYSHRKSSDLTWKRVAGLGDEAVYARTAHDFETNAPSAGFVVRKASNVFIVVGHHGLNVMPWNMLVKLTRKALSNNCA